MEKRGSDVKTKVIIVEDEDLYRDMLRVSLSQNPEIVVTGAYPDPQSALAAAEDEEIDVAVLDIDLSAEMNGFELGLQLRQVHKEVGIVLLSNHKEHAYTAAILRRELMGWSYLMKRSVTNVATLSRAVLGAAEGYVVLDPELTQDLKPRLGSRLNRLTPRQMEVLALIAQGYNNEGIARELGIAKKSVENTINQLYDRLDLVQPGKHLHQRVAAVLYYLKETQPEAEW